MRVLSAQIYFWLEEQLYSETNIGTQFFFLNIDILWKYVTKIEKHWPHPRKQNSQNWPYLNCNYVEMPTSAHRFFWFFWLFITQIMQINHKIYVDRLASLNIELQNKFLWRMCGLQNLPSWEGPSKSKKIFVSNET